MTALVQIFDAADLPVGSGVTVDSARWDDTGLAVSPTPTVAVADATNGLWLVTATDPATSRGGMKVLLSYDDGVETVERAVAVSETHPGVNVKEVNDVTVGGVGTAATPWGPA